MSADQWALALAALVNFLCTCTDTSKTSDDPHNRNQNSQQHDTNIDITSQNLETVITRIVELVQQRTSATTSERDASFTSPSDSRTSEQQTENTRQSDFQRTSESATPLRTSNDEQAWRTARAFASNAERVQDFAPVFDNAWASATILVSKTLANQHKWKGGPVKRFLAAFSSGLMDMMSDHAIKKTFGLPTLLFIRTLPRFKAYVASVAIAYFLWKKTQTVPDAVFIWLKSWAMSCVSIGSEQYKLRTKADRWLSRQPSVSICELSSKQRLQYLAMSTILDGKQRKVYATINNGGQDTTCEQYGNCEGFDDDYGQDQAPSHGKGNLCFRDLAQKYKILQHDGKFMIQNLDPETGENEFWCFGRNHGPCQKVVEDLHAMDDGGGEVNIYKNGSGPEWDFYGTQDARTIENVYMDASERSKLKAEVEEHLGPMKTYCKSKGMPWRKGYMFHGKPGCGKSTLAIALAACFGLSVYIVDFTEPSLTDAKLTSLLKNLGRGDMVLLEDIDSVGLTREVAERAPQAEQKAIGEASHTVQQVSDNHGDDQALLMQAPDAPAHQIGADPNKEESIPDLPQQATSLTKQTPIETIITPSPPHLTLSTVLNLLDGPLAPSNGQITVYTTNNAENLDWALTRSGRVDRKIYFGYVTLDIAEQIYNKMYEPCDGRRPEDLGYDPDSIPPLAKEFAKRLMATGTEVTPADVQVYIFRLLKNPQAALEGVQEWVRELEEGERKMLTQGTEQRKWATTTDPEQHGSNKDGNRRSVTESGSGNDKDGRRTSEADSGNWSADDLNTQPKDAEVFWGGLKSQHDDN